MSAYDGPSVGNDRAISEDTRHPDDSESAIPFEVALTMALYERLSDRRDTLEQNP